MAVKTLLTVFLSVIFVLLLSGCTWLGFSSADNSAKTHLDLIEHFAANKIKIDSVKPLMYSLAQAESGYCFKIGKREVGVYKYNLIRKKQKHRYQLVKDSGVLYINGTKFKALINGSFVMIDYDTHPDSEKIIKAFESF